MNRESFYDAKPQGGRTSYGHEQDIPSLGVIEKRMLEIEEEQVKAIDKHGEVSKKASVAKSNWEDHRDTVLTIIKDRVSRTGEKSSEDLRNAEVATTLSEGGESGKELRRTYYNTQSHLRHIETYLTSLRSRMSGLQTLAANIRNIA